MALKFLNIIFVMMTCLLIFRHGASKEWVKFERIFYYSSNSKITVRITSSSKQNIVHVGGKDVAVKCSLFISFGLQTGIYTCQDDDSLQYLVPSSNVTQRKGQRKGQRKHVKLYCDEIKDIIEGEEVNMSCDMIREYRHYFRAYFKTNVTIIWIQGKHHITQSHLTDTNTVTINQTLKGFQPGEGIFFYCILNYRSIYCYTLILMVHSQLMVEVQRLYETPEVDVNRNCFKCYAEGGSGNKTIYNLGLRGEGIMTQYNYNEPDERCFSNLPAGNYTVKCLVSTDVQNRSDELAFTIKDVNERITTFQDIKFGMPTKCKNTNQITIVFVTSTIIGLLIVLLGFIVCCYEQQKRNYRNTPVPVVHFQSNNDTISVGDTLNVSQTIEKNEIYCSIDDHTAE